MLYHLFDLLKEFDIPGQGLFKFLSFRAIFSFTLALVISIWAGKGIIRLMQKKQIGEEIRDLGLEGQMQKKGTPTMGGILIFLSIVIPVLLLADLTSIYTILMLVSTVWFFAIGFADDYIKVFKKNKPSFGRLRNLDFFRCRGLYFNRLRFKFIGLQLDFRQNQP